MLPLENIQLDYEANILDHGELCARYGITKDKLIRLAVEYKWSRREGSVPAHRYLAVIDTEEVTEGIYKSTEAENIFNEDDLKKRAMLSSVHVMATHKSDLERMRRETKEIGEKVLQELRQMPPVDRESSLNAYGTHARIQQMIVASFNSYTQAMQTQINLERKIYKLDSIENPTEQFDLVEKQNSLLLEMKQSLDDYAREKSAFSLPDPTLEREKVPIT